MGKTSAAKYLANMLSKDMEFFSCIFLNLTKRHKSYSV